MNTRLKIEAYYLGNKTQFDGRGKVKHFHAIIYPPVKAALGLVEGWKYELIFNGQRNLGIFTLEPYPPNALHFKFLKNDHIRTKYISVGEWYDVTLNPIILNTHEVLY